MWLAVAAMAVVSLARVEGTVGNAAVYSNPVLAFLAGQHNAATVSDAGSPQIVTIGSTRKLSGVYLHGASSGAWTAMLPGAVYRLRGPTQPDLAAVFALAGSHSFSSSASRFVPASSTVAPLVHAHSIPRRRVAPRDCFSE